MFSEKDWRDQWEVYPYICERTNGLDVYKTACVAWLNPTFELLVNKFEQKYYQPGHSPIDWDSTPHLMQTKNEKRNKFEMGELRILKEIVVLGALRVTIESWLVGYDLIYRAKANIVGDYKNDNAMVVHIKLPDHADEFVDTLCKLFKHFHDHCQA